MVTIDIKQKDNRTTMFLTGRLTIEDKQVFQSVVEEKVKSGNGVLGIDLNGLEYVDSAGIGDLIKLKMEAGRSYSGVYVFGLQSAVDRVFRVSGLNSVFDIISTEEFADIS